MGRAGTRLKAGSARRGVDALALVRLGAIILFASACGGETPPRPGGPSLLIVSVDTLRADHVSSYGYSRATTPSVDRLAREGALVSTVVAQRAATWPSLTSIMTGTHPRTHGVRRNGEYRASLRATLSESLKHYGFRTAAFLTNMTAARHRGFDHLETWPRPEQGRLRHDEMDSFATSAARHWLRDHVEENAGDRFFLWLHLIGPHHPYLPGADAPRRFDVGYRGDLDGSHETLRGIQRYERVLEPEELAHIVSLYDDEVSLVDERVGEVLDELDSLELADETLVVFVADHGEELYDHDFYFFHANSIYESVLRVPLVMRLPGVVPAGSSIGGVVETVDIAPTTMSLLGLPATETYEGVDLSGFFDVAEGLPLELDEAYSELGPEIHSLRTSRWQYIQNPKGYTSAGVRGPKRAFMGLFSLEAEELYDLRDDAGGRHNVAARHPEVVRALRARLGEWLSDRPSASASGELDPRARAELEALGYLDEDP